MRPTAVTWAVLGLIASKPRSGYDIKRLVDRSIRHFWAASYGQIYPELKRLEEAGWIAGDDASNGGRARRLYRITDAGRSAFAARLASLLGDDHPSYPLFSVGLAEAHEIPADGVVAQLTRRRDRYLRR